MSVTPSLVADLVGVAVFAASGASAGVVKRLDLFGVVFVGAVAALGGGIIRDLLIGAVPPYAFTHWEYLVVAVLAALLLFWLHPQFNRLRRTVLVLDAAGLGLFTVTGTLKALDAHVPAVGACVIGMISGIGGGLGRDLLTGEIPVVLRREIYAVASLLGAGVVTALARVHLNRPLLITGTALLIFVVRLLALRRNWGAPTPPDPLPPPDAGAG
ncbi:TRIC cation channel family protein [Rugosimonospora acidiphila]|uniref:TRIC cation channel family protein n=1 Tax=Rugosimonospora acidiphila TaxID=556531 RepID=A0ABP9RP71_9ACTN